MRRFIKHSLFALIVAATAGCTTVDLTDPQVAETTESPAALLNKKIDVLLAEQREICLAPQYEVLRQKNPCSNSNITFAQLADRSKITSNQRSQMIDAYTRMDRIYKEITILYEAYGTEDSMRIARARDWAYEQSIKNRLNLVNNGITWGQYLNQRMKINAEMMNRAQ